jgi:hypothetical protein
MEMIFCPNCQKLTGYKRALGVGTFFAVLLTAGIWLFALPFYPKRCITCGLSKSDSVAWYRTWRLALVLALGLVAFGAAMTALFPSHGSRPATIIHGPDYDKPTSSQTSETSKPSSPQTSETSKETSNTVPPINHVALGRIIPAGEIMAKAGNFNGNMKPPLSVTVVGSEKSELGNGNYVISASVRFSDAFIKVAQQQETNVPPSIETFRLGLMCGGSRPGCVPLQVGETYWLQFIHHGDAGYYSDRFESGDCNLARLGRELGKEASAVYYACVNSKE